MAPLRANVVIYIEGPILPLNVLQTSQLITKSLVVLENKDVIELNVICYDLLITRIPIRLLFRWKRKMPRKSKILNLNTHLKWKSFALPHADRMK